MTGYLDGVTRMAVNQRTLAAQAYDEIREDILAGRLRPGAKVVVRPLAEKLGLSPTPVKAALTALEREGFLLARPRRGFFVPEVSRQDMREIYELREVIDGIAARNAARQPDRSALIARLEKLYARQQAKVAKGNLSGYSDLDMLFHQAIWQDSGNRRLAQAAGNLLGQVRAGSGGSSRVPGRLRVALGEHEALLSALREGNPALAEKLARKHARLAGEALQKYMADPGDANG